MRGRVGVWIAAVWLAACAAPDADDTEIVQARAPSAETDESPSASVRSGNLRIDGVVESVRGVGATFAVTRDGKLLRIARGRSTELLDRAQGRPAPLASGAVVVARSSGEPGESDLWLVPEGGTPRALAPAPGPDDLPIALPDGRVAFVSARTTIASLWIVDPEAGVARQLTNRGLVAGGARVGFVPPPLEVVRATSAELTYDAGDGELWRVDLEDGTGKPIARGAR